MADQYFGKPFAREDKTVSTTAVTLTAATYSPSKDEDARCAVITVEAQPIRYTRDGTAPDNGATPPVGDVHASGNERIVLWGLESLQKFKAIRSGGTDSTIHITYFR